MSGVHERVTDPLARFLARVGVSPSAIATAGMVASIAAAGAFAYRLPRWGGALVLVTGLCELLHRAVARSAGRVSRFAAFYDTTLARAGDAVVFAGMAVFFLRGGVPAARVLPAVLVTFAALGAVFLVAYTRARADALGIDFPRGRAKRAEFLLLLGAPPLLAGAGPNGAVLFWMTTVLAVLAATTVARRLWRASSVVDTATARPRGTLAGRAPAMKRGA